MIQLEARHAAVKAEETRVLFPATMIEETIESATIISVPGLPAVVLSQNPHMVQILENAEHLAGELEKNGRTVCGEFSIIRHSTSHFAPNRILHECIVFKTMPQRQ